MTLVIVLLAAALLLILIFAFMVRLESFREEMDYIDLELQRSSADGKKYWKKKKRQLWLSLLIPFYKGK